MKIKQKNKFYIFVAVLQLIGGMLLFYGIYQDIKFTYPIAIAFIFIIICLLSSFLIFMNNENGITLAIMNYSLQIIDFSIPDILSFKYDIPIYGNVMLDINKLSITASAGIQTLIDLDFGYPDNYYFGINIFAIVILRLLLMDEEKLKNKVGWIVFNEKGS